MGKEALIRRVRKREENEKYESDFGGKRKSGKIEKREDWKGEKNGTGR
jgi:hypothetical protein